MAPVALMCHCEAASLALPSALACSPAASLPSRIRGRDAFDDALRGRAMTFRGHREHDHAIVHLQAQRVGAISGIRGREGHPAAHVRADGFHGALDADGLSNT